MKYCTNCGVSVLDENAKFCSACGAPQTAIEPNLHHKQNEGNNAARVTLCILTILGSILGILKGLFVEAFYSQNYGIGQGQQLPFGYASALFNLGTLVGAVLMLNKMKTGYINYIAFQWANISTVTFWAVYSTYFINNYPGQSSQPFFFLLASVTVIPSLVFMALYSFMVKKQLG